MNARLPRTVSLPLAALAALAAVSCTGGGAGNSEVTGTGGVSSMGGQGGEGARAGSGGAAAGVGGAAGGAPAGSGGVVGTGGGPMSGTGGAGPGAGGARGTGGAIGGVGGRLGTGGSGAGAGGATGIGGSTGAGGSTAALIENDTFWKDTSGTPIYSQGGGILKVGGTYYWYGVKYNGAVTYAANPTKLNSDTSFAAVTCYSSTNLVTWKLEGNILSVGAAGSTLDPSWLGRLGVVYNANTKKYVLISQYQGPAGTGELFATSNTPTGTFTFDHIQATITNVANMTTGDQTVFIDDDGSAYLICSSSMGRGNLYVAPIRASDSLNIEPATRIFGGAGREGNAMFKGNGRYYFCSSDLHGWNASHSYYISATNIMGPYGAEGVIGNTDLDFSHVSQTGLFYTVNGSAGSVVIFAGDRWSDFAGNGLGFNQWCPITFNGTTPVLQSVSEWSLDAAAGTWSVGPKNNYALNPSFEADRVAITQPAGWTTTTNLSGATPFTNVSGGHTGRWGWQLGTTAAYQAAIEQTVTNLPNGTYTLSVWVKSTGGQSIAQVYAKGFGGAEQDHSISGAMNAWTMVSIPGIAVSNGQCQIGVTTTASANQSVTMDDFSLVRTGS